MRLELKALTGPAWRLRTLFLCLLMMFIGAQFAPAGSAEATTPPATVRLGLAPRLPRGAVALASLPSGAPLQIDVVMQPRHPAALSSYAEAVSTPGSPLYRHYLGKDEFLRTFGPTPQEVQSVRRALVAEGLDPGRLSGNHLSIPVSATAGRLGRAFSIRFRRYRLGGDRVAFANTAAPLIPSSRVRSCRQ